MEEDDQAGIVTVLGVAVNSGRDRSENGYDDDRRGGNLVIVGSGDRHSNTVVVGDNGCVSDDCNGTCGSNGGGIRGSFGAGHGAKRGGRGVQASAHNASSNGCTVKAVAGKIWQ